MKHFPMRKTTVGTIIKLYKSDMDDLVNKAASINYHPQKICNICFLFAIFDLKIIGQINRSDKLVFKDEERVHCEVIVDKTTHSELKNISKKYGVSMNELLRNIVLEYKDTVYETEKEKFNIVRQA